MNKISSLIKFSTNKHNRLRYAILRLRLKTDV